MLPLVAWMANVGRAFAHWMMVVAGVWIMVTVLVAARRVVASRAAVMLFAAAVTVGVGTVRVVGVTPMQEQALE